MGRRRQGLGLGLLVLVIALSTVGAWVLGGALGGTLGDGPARPLRPVAPGAPARVSEVVDGSQSPFDGRSEGSSMGISPDGRRLYLTDNNGELAVVDVPSESARSAQVAPPPTPEEWSRGETRTGLAVSPDGRAVYLTDPRAGALRKVDTTTLAVTATLPMPAVPISVALGPDGSWLAVGDVAGSVTRVDTAGFRPVGTAHVTPAPVSAVATTADGRVLAATEPPGGLTVLDPDLHIRAVTPLRTPAYRAASLAVSRDGTRAYVVTGSSQSEPEHGADGGVSLVDLSSGRIETVVPTPQAVAVALSPDGRSLDIAHEASGDFLVAGEEQLWAVDIREVADGYPLRGSVADAESAGLGASPLVPSPDGRRLYAPLNGVTAIDLR